jgi:hypothetical protein
MPQWNGQWPGGRTYLDRHGTTRWQLERMHNGARYIRRLDARNESEALAELALFERDPDGYLTKARATRKAAEEAVFQAGMTAKVLVPMQGRILSPTRSCREQRVPADVRPIGYSIGPATHQGGGHYPGESSTSTAMARS